MSCSPKRSEDSSECRTPAAHVRIVACARRAVCRECKLTRFSSAGPFVFSRIGVVISFSGAFDYTNFMSEREFPCHQKMREDFVRVEVFESNCTRCGKVCPIVPANCVNGFFGFLDRLNENNPLPVGRIRKSRVL